MTDKLVLLEDLAVNPRYVVRVTVADDVSESGVLGTNIALENGEVWTVDLSMIDVIRILRGEI